MKNSYSVYYLMIVFLVIMIFVPPVLRIVWSDESSPTINNNQNIQEIVVSNKLNCEFNYDLSGNLISIKTTTEYYDKNVTYIEFRYNLESIKNTELMENSIFKEIQKIKNISGGIYNTEGNEEIIYFNNNISNNPNLKQYNNQDINVQKLYYETLGFKCNVIKD